MAYLVFVFLGSLIGSLIPLIFLGQSFFLSY